MSNPFKRNSFEDLEFYDEEDNYYEPQIIESYTEEEYEQNQKNLQNNKKYKKNKRIINTVFSIIVLILFMIILDVVCVARYNIGPFFAIKTDTLKDGGTKIYYGIGYKVIKYNQLQGRRDREIGNWNLEINTNPIDTTDIDLAIEFENNYQKTNKKYYKKFVRLTSTVKRIDAKNNKLVLGYLDEDKKYTLDIVCSMAKGTDNLKSLNLDDSVSIIGTIESFKIKTNKENNSVYISNCFVQQNVSLDNINVEETEQK